MPTLAVVRHAKADRPADVADADRPLADRGRRDARAAGGWLRETLGRPDLVVASPARRARETAEELLEAWAPDRPPVVHDESIYEASLGDLLLVVRGLDDDEGDEGTTNVAVLVGHDPSVSALVEDLTGAPVEMRTCAIAVLRWPGTWADAPPGGCELSTQVTPRA